MCPQCQKSGLKYTLQARIYTPDQLRDGKKPIDADKYRQCHHCGLIIETKNIKKIDQLTSDIELDQDLHMYTFDGNNLKKVDREKLSIDRVKDEELKKELLRRETIVIQH